MKGSDPIRANHYQDSPINTSILQWFLMAEQGRVIHTKNLKELILKLLLSRAGERGKGALNQDIEQMHQTTTSARAHLPGTKSKAGNNSSSSSPVKVSEHTANVHFLRRDEEHFCLQRKITAITGIKSTEWHSGTP